MIELPKDTLSKLEEILTTDESDFVKLAEIGGLDPATAFRYANLRDCDFNGSDLSGFDFTGADLRGCIGLPTDEEAEKIGLILTDAKRD
ncbi:MAG: pentapeptide repeat-containing protein [Pseudomonadota bacterium]